ncbi:TPA: hypothetical protein ACPGFQ_001085 [Haemophilus influenzae]|nr:hypothetical protein [Haemophilus influenzae]
MSQLNIQFPTKFKPLFESIWRFNMALVNTPDESIFASSAKRGEVDNFPDLLRGWGICLK